MVHGVIKGQAFAPALGLALLLSACGGAAAPASAPASAPPANASSTAGTPSGAPTSASAKPAASAAPSAKPAAAAPSPLQTTPFTGKPEKSNVTLTYGTASGTDTFARMAAQKGLFQKYGVTVDVQYAQSTTGLATLTSGQAQFNLSDGVLAVQAVTVGQPVKVLAYFDQVAPYMIVAQPDIKTPQDLKGKSVAVSKLGDTSDIALHIGLKPSGINPTTDMKELQIGNSPARWAAISSKQVDAAIMDEDAFQEQAKAAGLNILVSLKSQRIPYVASALMATDDFLKANPVITEAVLRGLIDGAKFVADPANKDAVEADMAKELKLSPGDKQLEDAYQAYHLRSSGDPFPDNNGIDTIIGALKDIDAKQYSTVTRDQVLDPSFMTKIRGH